MQKPINMCPAQIEARIKELSEELRQKEAEQGWWSTPGGNYNPGQSKTQPPTPAPKSFFATLLDRICSYGR